MNPLKTILPMLMLSVGCLEPQLPAQNVPQLQSSKQEQAMSGGMKFEAGERMKWSVHWRGVRVGSATLSVVGASVAGAGRKVRVESRFRTSGLAEKMHPLRHRFVSTIGGEPLAREDVHSAFGKIRNWVGDGAGPTRMQVIHNSRSYKLKLASPVRDSSLSLATWRVEAEATPTAGAPIQLTLWFSADALRLPLRLQVAQQGRTFTARLITES